MKKPTILILCTGNSCRSQMAEYFLQSVVGDAAVIASAGSKPSGYVHPLAIRAMQENGYDLSQAESKSLTAFSEDEVEVVVTVCGNAEKCCPTFIGQSAHYCWMFDDPADAVGTEDEQLVEFRRIRDEIERIFTAYGRGWLDGLALRKGKSAAEGEGGDSAVSPVASPHHTDGCRSEHCCS